MNMTFEMYTHSYKHETALLRLKDNHTFVLKCQ